MICYQSYTEINEEDQKEGEDEEFYLLDVYSEHNKSTINSDACLLLSEL